MAQNCRYTARHGRAGCFHRWQMQRPLGHCRCARNGHSSLQTATELSRRRRESQLCVQLGVLKIQEELVVVVFVVDVVFVVVVVFVNVNEYLPLRTLVKREGSSGSTPSGSPTSATGASTRSSRLRLVMWFRIQRLSPPSGLRSSRWCAVRPPPNLASLLYPHNIRALSPLLILDRLVLCRSVVSPFPPEGQGVRSPCQEPASGKV